MEIWKVINDYTNYSISNYGRVKNNKTNRLLKLFDNYGYSRVTLPIKKKFLVHRLVAIHFLENKNNLPQVNHKDDNRKNNHYKNLYWGTQLENMKDRNIRKGWSGGRKKKIKPL